MATASHGYSGFGAGSPGFGSGPGVGGFNFNGGYDSDRNYGPQIPILRYENVNNGDGNYRYR